MSAPPSQPDSRDREIDDASWIGGWLPNALLWMLGGVVLALAFHWLDQRDARYLYNPWTYVVLVPIALYLISTLLNTLVSRLVERSMQAAFLLSVLVHLLILSYASHLIVFSRSWPDLFDSLSQQRRDLERQTLHAKQYVRIVDGAQSGPRADYLRFVPTRIEAAGTESIARRDLSQPAAAALALPTWSPAAPAQPATSPRTAILRRQPTDSELALPANAAAPPTPSTLPLDDAPPFLARMLPRVSGSALERSEQPPALAPSADSLARRHLRTSANASLTTPEELRSSTWDGQPGSARERSDHGWALSATQSLNGDAAVFDVASLAGAGEAIERSPGSLHPPTSVPRNLPSPAAETAADFSPSPPVSARADGLQRPSAAGYQPLVTELPEPQPLDDSAAVSLPGSWPIPRSQADMSRTADIVQTPAHGDALQLSPALAPAGRHVPPAVRVEMPHALAGGGEWITDTNLLSSDSLQPPTSSAANRASMIVGGGSEVVQAPAIPESQSADPWLGRPLPRRRPDEDLALNSTSPAGTPSLRRAELTESSSPAASAAVAKPAYRQRIDRLQQHGQGDEAQLLQRTERAIERGLEFLARFQRTDGSWRLQDFDSEVLIRSDTAATGLALLAFQGAGYTHLNSRFASQIHHAIEFLARHQRPDGDLYIPQDPASNQNAWLYSHSIATLSLCEAYGMTQDERLRPVAQRAVDFMASTQDPRRGGWRYRPGSGADTSVTGWYMMALQSARLAGLSVPPRTITAIEQFVGHAQSEDSAPHLYRYNPFAPNTNEQRHGLRPTAVMTSVGLLMRLHLGWHRDRPDMIRGAEFLLDHPPEYGSGDQPLRDTYYWYYATQVIFHMGGDYWQQWHEKLYPLLLDHQVHDGPYAGSWAPLHPVPDLWARYGGRLYVTTLNLLSLEVRYRHLPLYESTAPWDD